MASIDGTMPRNWPPGLERGPDGPEGPIDQADVGHDERVDRDGDVDLPGEVVELVHRALQERDPVVGLGREPFPGPLDHAGGEVQRDDPSEPRGEVGEQRPGAAAEVGRGLVRGVGDGVERRPERILDARRVRVEEDLVVPLRVPAPVPVLVLKFAVGQGPEHASLNRVSDVAPEIPPVPERTRAYSRPSQS